MSDAPVQLDQVGSVATITLNRPAAGNAIDIGLARALETVAAKVADDCSVRCVILTGAGKLFCGGGDVSVFASMGDGFPAYLEDLAKTLHRSVETFARMAKPLVVLVNGPAAGAGLSLAISGDVVLASDRAHFTAAYSSVGLTPDGGMSWLLPRLVGLRRAQEIILTNRRISSGEAAAIGLVTRAIPAEELAGEGLRVANELAVGPVAAIAGGRALLGGSLQNDLTSHLAAETAMIAEAGAGVEAKEGIAAFLARRAPDFAGRC